jgi:hypothetical protein
VLSGLLVFLSSTIVFFLFSGFQVSDDAKRGLERLTNTQTHWGRKWEGKQDMKQWRVGSKESALQRLNTVQK